MAAGKSGVKSAPASRWAVSFADLALLLLGFFVLLHAGKADVGAVAASTRAALGVEEGAAGPALDSPSADLFEPGEARLTARARAELLAIGTEAARAGARIRIESIGVDAGARRFDGWELAAARAAAAARALREGGIADEAVEIVMPGRGQERTHRLVIRLTR